MKPTITLSLALLLIAATLSAQKLPTSNVYLFDIKIDADSVYQFTNPTYLTAFNSKGYNNQPFFMNDDELYITVQMANDTTQTDIYSLNFKTGIKTQVTDTPVSEYSPTFKSGNADEDDIAEFTCIRVENDGKSTQRLWRFPLDRSNNGDVVFKDIRGVGYHAWATPTEAVLFIVGSPHRLMLANTYSGKTQNIGDNIGRCLQRKINGIVYYVRKLSPDSWFIRALTPLTNKTITITETLPEVEDFALMPDGSILMAKGSKLFRHNGVKDTQWVEIADFSNYGLNNISRLAIRDGRYLALVNN
jgi:hypothetical protein